MDPTIGSSLVVDHWFRLRELILPEEQFQQHGYILKDFTPDELELKKRCQGCGKTMSQFRRKSRVKDDEKKEKQKASDIGALSLLEEKHERLGSASLTVDVPRPTILRCRFHHGKWQRKNKWSCCGKGYLAPPCSAAEHHTARRYPPGEFEQHWRMFPTPEPTSRKNIRLAVAIDCEMGISAAGDSELIRITVVDYFSSETLIDKLVFPDVAMDHLNTRFSGVTPIAMNDARKRGNCLLGRDDAREALWEFVGPYTIVVGHAAQNDLIALRCVHRVVVDTLTLESLKPLHVESRQQAQEMEQSVSLTSEHDSCVPQSTIPKQKSRNHCGPMSLKRLALEKLGREIQTGKKGHDSLEDAVAARDLAWWVVLNRASQAC